MGDRITTFIHAVVILSFMISLGAMLGGMFGFAWWSEEVKSQFKSVKIQHGILRSCVTNLNVFESNTQSKKECKFRDDILEFRYFYQNKKLKPDIVFILLLISSTSCLLALICCLTLFCCRGDKGYWKCGTIATIVSGIVGALACFGGVIYAEVQSTDLGWDVDWSLILAWLGATTVLFASVLSIVLLCIPYKGRNGGDVNVRPMYVGRYDYNNTGYNRD